MKKFEALKQQKNKILEKIRKKNKIARGNMSNVPTGAVKIISNVAIEPLEGWPTIFDRSLLPPFPTDVQKFSIPYILIKEGVSVISETGSGKTLSYVLPYVHILENENGKLLVVVPTRELVPQISQLFGRFSSGYLKVIEITGGKSIDLQRLELSSPFNVIVSTPGRLKELIELKCIGCFDYIVVDEVDRLLSCNFKEDMEFILEHANPKVRNYFSATPFEYYTGTRILVGDVRVNKNIEEHFLYVERLKKADILKEILKSPEDWLVSSVDTCGLDRSADKIKNADSRSKAKSIKKIIIFCNTIKMCESLHKQLKFSRILHSRKNMAERESIVEDMHSKEGVLIATDLAGRGIDIKDIDLVINYDFPTSIETYIHRCGRTGRQRSGISISMLCDDDKSIFGKLKRLIEEGCKVAPAFLSIKDNFIVD